MFSKTCLNKMFILLFSAILHDRGVAELNGWSVALESEGGDTLVEMNGGDFVLDGLGGPDLELPPAFPVKHQPQFIVTYASGKFYSVHQICHTLLSIS